MTWQVLETEPAYGICDQCRKHECGITEDGKHKWIKTGMVDSFSFEIVIGYKCVEAWAANLGINKVVQEVKVPPTDEQIARYAFDAMKETLQKHIDAIEELAEEQRKPVKRKNA